MGGGLGEICAMSSAGSFGVASGGARGERTGGEEAGLGGDEAEEEGGIIAGGGAPPGRPEGAGEPRGG